MKRRGVRRGLLGFAFAFGALVSQASMGCRDPKREDAPAPAGSAAAATAPNVVASASASVAVAVAAPPESTKEEVVDAGTDAGKRKLRRLVADAPEAGAGAIVTETAQAPLQAPASPPADPRGAKQPSKPMGDDLPYGGSTGSAAPLLKKAPLPPDDPWGR
jgi:hypothetical protein